MAFTDFTTILKEEDISGITKLISEDSKYEKLQRKLNVLIDKLNVLEDRFDVALKESVKKFAQKKDIDYFQKLISKQGGYVTPGGILMRRMDPLMYIGIWEREKSFSYPGYCYWTDVVCWAKFRGKEKLSKKMEKPYQKANVLEAKQSDIIVKLTKAHLKKNYSDEEFNQIMAEIKRILKANARAYKRRQSDFAKLIGGIRRSLRTSRELNDITGGIWETARIGTLMRKEFETINDSGYLAILNSSGEVVRFINAENIRQSLIDLTYETYETKLQDNATHFSEYRKIYFEKHADS